MLVLLLGKYVLRRKGDGVPMTCFWSCIVGNKMLVTWKRYLFVSRKLFISNQMILCMLKVGIQLMAALFFSVTATAVAMVFEGPVQPLARNRMKNSAAVQKYGA